MDVTPLPTVEELTDWMRMPGQALALAEKIADTAFELRQAASSIYSPRSLGVYWNDAEKQAAIYADPNDYGLQGAAVALLKNALSRVAEVRPTLLIDPLDGCWVKVAYTPEYGSPAVRGAGEWLGFFPGPKPFPHQSSVYGSMLASGLVGAGLGYGTGYLMEQLLPERWEKGRLRKTLGAVGGLAGIAPSALWGIANRRSGKAFGDPSLLNTANGADPQMSQEQWKQIQGADLGERYKTACAAAAARFGAGIDALIKTGEYGDTFAEAAPPKLHSTLDVNIDAMGRTLWESGASPQTAGMTMGALAAAQQMPGGERPGFVTPWQMGQLAAHMGAGYVSGALVGSALGMLTGMPDETQEKLRQTGMYVGLINAIVPRLFGQ